MPCNIALASTGKASQLRFALGLLSVYLSICLFFSLIFNQPALSLFLCLPLFSLRLCLSLLSLSRLPYIIFSLHFFHPFLCPTHSPSFHPLLHSILSFHPSPLPSSKERFLLRVVHIPSIFHLSLYIPHPITFSPSIPLLFLFILPFFSLSLYPLSFFSSFLPLP